MGGHDISVGEMMGNAKLVWQGDGQAAAFPPSVTYQERFLTLRCQARASNRALWGTQ
jgi:hypothetical protein